MRARGATLRRWFLGAELLVVAILATAVVFMSVVGRDWNRGMEADLLEHGLMEASYSVRTTQVAWEDLGERMDALARLGKELTLADARGDQQDRLLRESGLRAALAVAGRPALQLSIARPDGRVWWSSIAPFVANTDVADRPYFQAIVRDGLDFNTEGPLMGRISGRSSIAFSFAARDAVGRLAGVIIVSLDIAEIRRVTESVATTSPMVMIVFKRDGTILSTTSGKGQGHIGRAPAWLDSINATVPVTDFGRSPIDDLDRFNAYLAVSRLDLLVGVGLDENALLELRQDHHAQTKFLGWAAMGFLMLLLVVASGTIWRAWRALENGMRRSAIAIRKDFLHQIADRTSDMIAVLDHEYRYLYVNAAAEALLGVAPDSLIGQPAGTLVHQADRQGTFQKARQVRDPGAVNTVVFRFSGKDGAERWMEAQLNPIVFEQTSGPPFRGTFMIARDVSAQHSSDRALSELRAELDVIARTGPGTLYQAVIEPEGHWRVTFPIGLGRLARTLLIDPETAGHDFLSLMHPEDLNDLRFGKGGFHRADEACLEYRWIDDRDQQRFIRDIGVVTARASDHIIVSGYLFDVTREVEQRQRLDRASRLLSLGQMAVGLAHELNQPLAAISMAAENGAISLEIDPKGTAVARQKFERISALALRAGDIIEHIRQFGRPGKASGQPTDVAAVVEEACAVLHERIGRAGITLSRRVAASLPPVRATPGLLQQVLVNLIANACDALAELPREDGAAVRRIAVTADQWDGLVRVSVADNAGGIPEAVMQQIFEPFFTTKPVGQGTGLGLSVSFGIVLNFGGAINAHNQDGGAVFEVDLPVWAEATPVP